MTGTTITLYIDTDKLLNNRTRIFPVFVELAGRAGIRVQGDARLSCDLGCADSRSLRAVHSSPHLCDHQRPRDRRRSLHQGQGVLCFVCALGAEYRDQHGCSQGESGREWRAGQGRGSQVNPGLITI